MSHKYITIDCRNKIDVLNNEGYSARKIAKILGYHHSSISRKLKQKRLILNTLLILKIKEENQN